MLCNVCVNNTALLGSGPVPLIQMFSPTKLLTPIRGQERERRGERKKEKKEERKKQRALDTEKKRAREKQI